MRAGSESAVRTGRMSGVEHTLELSRHGVRLVPLSPEHAADLAALVDPALWAGMTTPLPDTPDAMAANIAHLVGDPTRMAFAVVDESTGAVAGSTTYYEISREVGRLEIGSTFYGRAWWGGHLNPAVKHLLLKHAFEDWGMARVALRADSRNTRSTAAIRRLGATYEGTLRGHRLAPDGSRGDTAYFSVLADEWPTVEAGLLARLADRA